MTASSPSPAWTSVPGAEAGEPMVVEPAGLSVVDTRDWTVRVLDPRASAAVGALGGRVVVALGWEYGVAVFEPGGRTRLRVPSQRLGGLEVAGRYGYAGLGQEYRRHRTLVLDLEEGRIVSRPRAPGWLTIVGDDPPLCWC